MTVATYSVAELADLTAAGKTTIYLELETTGEVFGVKALKIRSRWLIPRAPIDRMLGIEAREAS